MNEIKKIIIRTYSGWCPVEMSYEDKLTVTNDNIKYEYKPGMISEDNPKVKWDYSTSTNTFRKLYDELSGQVWKILHDKEMMMLFCTDIGGVDFTVVLQDNKRVSQHYQVPETEFRSIFSLIEQMIDDFMPIKNGYYWHSICEDDDE